MTKNIYTNQKIYGTQEVTSLSTVNKLKVVKGSDDNTPTAGQALVAADTSGNLKYITLSDSDEKVKQSPSSVAGEHYILLKKSANATEETDGVLFANPSSITLPSINLSTGKLTIPALRVASTTAPAVGQALVASDTDGNITWGDPAPKTYVQTVSVDNSAKKLAFTYLSNGESGSANLSFAAGVGVELGMSDNVLTINADTAFHAQVFETLPTASATYKNTIALIPNASAWAASTAYVVGAQVYVTASGTTTYYQCIKAHTSGSTFDSQYWSVTTASYTQYACTSEDSGTTWSWKQIGSTNIDLSNYVQLTKVGGGTQTMTTPLAISSLALATNAYRNISAGSADPTGGSLGDVYLQVGGTPHLGTETVGSTVKPIYLLNGVPVPISGTVGSSIKPIYLSSGTLTELSSNVGAADQPVYLSGGEIVVANKLAFSGGTCITVSGSTVSTTTTNTITHNNVTRTDPDPSSSSITNHKFTAVTGVTSSAQGHITAVQKTEFTIPGTTIYTATGSVTLTSSVPSASVNLSFVPKMVQLYEDDANGIPHQADADVQLAANSGQSFTVAINAPSSDVTLKYMVIGW